jgi:hypothetical protein
MVSQGGGKRPYGYAEKVGRWSINLGRLDPDSVEAMNQIADDVVGSFLQAFADLCTVEHAEGDLVEIEEDYRLSNVRGELPLEQTVEATFRPRSDTAIGVLSNRAGLSSVLLVCSIAVEGDRAERLVLPDALYFHYNSGLSSRVGQPMSFDSAHVTVTAEVDPWVDAPLQGGRFLDNRTIAALNRPRLERALRNWEAAIGKPIDELDSAYPDFIDRYGFRPGGEPDPP